jgi:unsaturated rhamnogalacturonyl hydrolase
VSAEPLSPSRPSILQRLEAAADLLTRYEFACWHYGDSIGFEGLLAASRLLSTPRYEGFVYGALKSWIPRARPYSELDNTAPGHAMCLCYEQTQDQALLTAATDLAEFLLSRPLRRGAFISFAHAPLREPYGETGLSSEERALLDNPGSGIFVDCLHFDAPFFVHLGALRQDETLVEIGAAQAVAMIDLLQDSKTGLFWHFWLERTEETYGFGWGRGQGWALLGMLDVLEHLPRSNPSWQRIADSVVRLSQALRERQHASGHWPTLVHEADSYLESSTALFVATGFLRGMELGVLDGSEETVIRRAWNAGAAVVTDGGDVTGVSAAVWASTAQGHYRAVPTGFIVPWGQGPLLTAAEAVGARYGIDRLESAA